MCQAISEGGRRCPAHRRDTITVIHITREATNLPQDVTEDIFTELRREARHLQSSNGLEDSYQELMTRSGETLEGLPNSERYREIFAERSRDESPAPDTAYALTRLRTAAAERSQALHQELQTIAEENGITLGQAREQWEQIRTNIKSGEVEVSEDHWNDEVQEDAFDKNLPHDRASVSALMQLRTNAEGVRGERRITRSDMSHRSSALVEAGYDPEGGRLEMVFQSNPDHVYTWHSVPEETWEAISETAARPMSIFHHRVRGNSDYAYESPEAAERDAHTVRCGACGQFRASSHTCPERVTQEVGGVETERVTPEVAAQVNNNLRDASEEIENGEVSPTEVVNATVAEAEDETPVEDVPEEETPASVGTDETGEPQLELPYNRQELIPEDADATDRIEAYDLDRQIDAGVIRAQELMSNETSDPREIAEDGITQSGEIAHREAEHILDINSRGEGAPQASAIANRYAIETLAYLRDVDNLPEGEDAPRRNSLALVLQNYESRGGADRYYHSPESRHYVAAFDPDNFATVGSYYGGNVGLRHTPVKPGPFNVSVEERPHPWRQGRTQTIRSVTDEERARVQSEYAATADGQLERETVDRNQTVARTYAPRMNNARGVNLLDDHRVAWAGVRDVRRVLAEDGATISAPIEYRLEQNLMVRDEHGNVLTRDGQATVTGTLAVTREGDNLRTTSGRHELRCNCEAYRRNYHCRHVDFVRDNGFRVARNMMSTSSRSGGAAGDSPFQSQLAGRTDFNHFTEEDGTLVARFNSANATRRHRPTTEFSRLARADEISSIENPSVEDTMLVRMDSGSTLALPTSRPVNMALSRAGRVDIELPPYGSNSVRDGLSQSQAYYDRAQITGTVSLTRDDDGNVVANGERMRCSCGRFVSASEGGSGTCPHFERYLTMVERHYNGVGDDETISYDDARAINEHAANSAEIRVLRELEQERINAEARGEQLDEAQLRERLEARIQREREEAEERARRAEELRLEREREYAEQQRLANLSFAERAEASEEAVRASRQRYLDSEPEFARDLALYNAEREAKWENVEEGYGDNVNAIREDFDAALAAREDSNSTHLEPLAGDVTDGICDPNVPGHRKFGVELEIDFQRGVDKSTAINNILTDMRAEGLTSQARIGHYHSGRTGGWQQWNLESDVTVAAEMVSPLMDDTPENWENMGKVLDIMKRHGAIPTTRTGSHVHISTGSYLQSLAKHSELTATVQEHENVLYRAAADPKRRKHRGGTWCVPNVTAPSVNIGNDQQGSNYNDPAIHRLSSHANMLNLEASTGLSKKEHAEFRMWDGSLDLATIQQQVATSAALVDYADRKVNSEGQYTGEGRTRGNFNVPSGSTEASDDALKNAASLADKIFRRQSDRKRFISMFAANKWS